MESVYLANLPVTSKENHGFGALNTYGFRGEALASISTMGLVDITSQVAEEDTVTKLLKKGEALYLGPAKRELGRTRGTNVMVRDLFHGVPVRQAELAAASSSSVLAACKKVIESLALAHPQVCWILWANGSRGTRKVLSLQGCSTTLEAFKELYGAAGVEKVQHVYTSAGPRRIDGFISLEGAVTRAHQHLFINGYPIENSELHHIISKRFAKSPFGSMASDLMDDAPMGGKRPSPRRLERYPVYVLNLTLPADEVDASYEPRKMTLGYRDIDSVQKFLLGIVEDFLAKNGFVGVPSRREATPGSPTPRSVAAWSTRSGKRARARSNSPTPTRNVRRSVSCAPEESLNRLYEERIKSVEAALQSANQPEPPEPEANPGRNLIQDLIAVSLKMTLFVLTYQAADDGVLRIGRAGTTVGDDEQEDPTTLTKTLPGPEVDISLSNASLQNASVLRQIDKKFIPCVLEADGRKTLAIFDQHAADERASLEMILETLCKSFANDTMPTTALEEGTVRLVLSRQEVEHLETPGVRPLLHRWGIRLGLAQPDGDYAQVNVYAVPELLDRLARKQATELTRLLRLYLPEAAQSIDEIQALLSSLDAETDHTDGKSWNGVMRWMPREMLELAKSKACRGAVMFEDALDQDQCERLVSRLAGTRNPWACAHGRPTVVPLCVIDGAECGRRPIDWAKIAAEN